MSEPAPAFGRPEHDAAEAARWFNQWHVYQSIVAADWMCHRDIFSAIKHWVLLRHPGPFTLLDLGCGDAAFIQGTFTDTGLWLYTGVDASPAALAKARGTLSGGRFQVRLVEADLLAYLDAEIGSDGPPCDVILASYAVHHLPAREKQTFFQRACAQLAPGGSLLFADLFRRGEETRAEALDAFVARMRDTWVGMHPEALRSTAEHVTQCDFPETVEAIRDMAREAGFPGEPRMLVCDETGFHRLLAFTKAPDA